MTACVQVTIYDDLHMGDHVGIVVHYVNAPSAHHQGGVSPCLHWERRAWGGRRGGGKGEGGLRSKGNMAGQRRHGLAPGGQGGREAGIARVAAG